MEEATLQLAQSLARQTIYEESPPGSPKATRTHAKMLQEKVQGFRYGTFKLGDWCRVQ